METIAINEFDVQAAFALEGSENAPFELRYDEDEEMYFIVHTDSGYAVTGDASESGVVLYFFNEMAGFGYDEYEAFNAFFWETIENLRESGVATLDDSFATV